MKRQTDQPQNPGRRMFAKSVTTTLLAGPFLFTGAEGQERRPQAPELCASPTSTEGSFMPTPCPPPGVVMPTEGHEPPVIITDGSLQMECEKKMIRQGGIASPPPQSPRRHLYEFDAYLYGEMLRLEVITEYQKVFTTECYDLRASGSTPGVRFATLKIWLQRLEGGAWNADDIDPAKTDAHLFFTYQDEAATDDTPAFKAAVVETDKKFGDIRQGLKQVPTFKHHHGGYGHKKQFRIGRWRLFDSAGSLLVGNSVGTKTLSDGSTGEVLSFQLVPRFFHLEYFLKAERAKRRMAAPRR